MNGNKNQIRRIAYYEDIFDRISAAVKALNRSADELNRAAPLIEELSAYYRSAEWKKDFSDDEAGILPTGLKRGVLSEDGVYDLLDEIEQYKSILHTDEKSKETEMEEQYITVKIKTKGEKCEMTDAEIKRWYETKIAGLFDPRYGTPEIEVKVERK